VSLTHAFSVDVEEGFHSQTFITRHPIETWDSLPSRVVPQTERLLELLSRHGHHGTFFVLGWIAERHPQLVRSIADAGHEVASHGYAHRLVYELGPEMFLEDLRRSKAAIESACGAEVRGYRGASFSITPRSLWALEILAEEGFAYDSSVYPVRHHRYGIPDSPLGVHRREGIIEVPIATLQAGPVRIGVGGGAYMRFLPQPVWFGAISRVAQERPLTLYVHPWECDPDQPRLSGPPIARLRQYGGQRSTLKKLDAAFERFRFGTFAELAADGHPG
jgi:polysaccharide deacetylase family protein (PEP-CTERM system associated)